MGHIANFRGSLCAIPLSLVIASAALAADPAAPGASERLWDVSFGATLTSDYVSDGFSQTDNDPALQGYVELTFRQFYLGVWASNVDFGTPGPSAEVDYYGGVRFDAGRVSLDFGALYYAYYDDLLGIDSVELLFKASVPLSDTVTLSGSVGYQPEWADVTDNWYNADATVAWAFHEKWTASATIGRSFEGAASSGPAWTWWNAGIAWTPVDWLTLDLRYWDSDVGDPGLNCPDLAGTKATCDERIVGSVSVAFALSDLIGAK